MVMYQVLLQLLILSRSRHVFRYRRAPEGVLAAAALRCIGGQMEARLKFYNEDEKLRAKN